jgi:hypothetical protein
MRKMTITPRLLSPDEAATFLALGSRWSVYRLIRRGDLPVLRIAGKLRVDVVDLERLIEAAKLTGDERPAVHRSAALAVVPRALAPARRATRVTVPRPGDSPATSARTSGEKDTPNAAGFAARRMRNAVRAAADGSA